MPLKSSKRDKEFETEMLDSWSFCCVNNYFVRFLLEKPSKIRSFCLVKWRRKWLQILAYFGDEKAPVFLFVLVEKKGLLTIPKGLQILKKITRCFLISEEWDTETYLILVTMQTSIKKDDRTSVKIRKSRGLIVVFFFKWNSICFQLFW